MNVIEVTIRVVGVGWHSYADESLMGFVGKGLPTYFLKNFSVTSVPLWQRVLTLSKLPLRLRSFATKTSSQIT